MCYRDLRLSLGWDTEAVESELDEVEKQLRWNIGKTKEKKSNIFSYEYI